MPYYPTEFYYLAQILLSIILGGLLGVQRARSGKPAGPRTFALVAAGSTMITILAAVYATPSIIGQIVVGIGFLGAGTIMHRSDSSHVEGLTTAAGLWMVSAIGIGIGARQYVLALGTTLMIFLLFMFNDRLLEKSGKK